MIKFKKPIFPVNQFVKYIWLYESPANCSKKDIQTFIVEGCPIIIFHYKQPIKCKSGENNWISHPNQCLIGQIKSFGQIVESGNEGMVAIVFHPDGLFPFIKIPLDELTGQIVDLSFILGSDIKEIFSKVCEAKTDDNRIEIIEQFLLWKIKSDLIPDSKNIRFAINQMQLNTKINISTLASDINMSKRNFERKFLEKVGLTPMFYNRIVRFQKALELMNQKTKLSYTELTYLSGYFDQSHFIRDFKQFYGQPPKEFDLSRNFG